ncbi:MAG: hypothetical protein AAB632_02655 [Patescibacteria group bacterium]
MKSSIKPVEFLELPLDATAEQIVSTLEEYVKAKRAIDRKALLVISRRKKDYREEHYQRMILAARKGYGFQLGQGRLGDALEYSNIAFDLYPLSIK